jgi:recombination protein RecR
MDSIEKLKNLFSKFPTVGQRTAGRFVYYIMKLPKDKTDELVNAIYELKNKIKLCKDCFNPYEDNGERVFANLCEICLDARRNKNLLCIVEKETDLLSIEATRKYNGLFFILGGNINNLRINELKNRVKAGNFSEIIVALNPTPEGRATSALVEKEIKDLLNNAKITHLAKGIPVGGELEYADEETLESAFEGRK